MKSLAVTHDALGLPGGVKPRPMASQGALAGLTLVFHDKWGGTFATGWCQALHAGASETAHARQRGLCRALIAPERESSLTANEQAISGLAANSADLSVFCLEVGGRS
eukprot:scaffold348451_cov45-Prasinocladus_malaysianus.AAC.1